jgi:glycosyltransferase involved in cell wall biosynthesis
VTTTLHSEPGMHESTGRQHNSRGPNDQFGGQTPGVFLMTNSFETGGSERQFAALAQSLDPLSFRVDLGCIQTKGAFLEGLSEVTRFRLGGSLYGPQSIRSRFLLGRHLRGSNIAIAHAFDFYTNLVLIPVARMVNVPVVIGSQRQLGDLLTPAQFRAQLAVFRWCDAVVCNSRAAAKHLIERGLPEAQTVVIGNGLPDSCFAETLPAFPKRPGHLRVGMIARMNTLAKNHREFLRAAAKIRTRLENVEFVLVGDGPLRQDLEHEAERMGLGSSAHFLGDRRDISAVLASLDVSVLPSGSESLSNVIIESMAAGVPVVAYTIGGNRELLTEDRGILVAPGDQEELANAVERLLRTPNLRRQLSENARKFAKANFTIEQMQKCHGELYSELLEKKRWRTRMHVLGAEEREVHPRPTRVCIVAASPRYVGGQSVQAELLLQHWRNDTQVQTRLVPIDPPIPRGLKWVDRVPGLRTIVRLPFYLHALWQGLKDADVAHIFSASYWSFLVAPVPAWFVARLLRKKVLIHYHSGEARDHLRRFRTAVPVLKRVDLLVVPSRYLVDVFHEFGLNTKAVPNIVDISQFSFRVRNPMRPYLVCTRGFHRYYSVDVVVRAFAEVQRSFPEARLDLVGGGPLEAEIRTLVKKLGISGINFAGVAARQEIARLYDDADIFINASWLDNMPVSILEAFAAGTPVVSTAPEGIRYLVDHERTGLLSDVGDPSALARNVIRILEDAGLASRLAHNAHEESRHYSWETVRQQWLDVYDSLAPSLHTLVKPRA